MNNKEALEMCELLDKEGYEVVIIEEESFDFCVLVIGFKKKN